MEDTPTTIYNLQLQDPVQEYEDPEEDQEDALSLCDLPLHNDTDQQQNPTSPSDPSDFFEFSTDPNGYSPIDTVLFCGKSIPYAEPISIPTRKPQINDPFCSRSESLRFSPTSNSHSHFLPARSDSLRSPATGNCRSPSSNSRKHKALIGLVKYHQPEMELSDIRKRQSRRAPVPMFPVNGGEQPVVAGGRSGGKGHWGLMTLMRPLRCRSHFISALAKAALGCIPRV